MYTYKSILDHGECKTGVLDSWNRKWLKGKKTADTSKFSWRKFVDDAEMGSFDKHTKNIALFVTKTLSNFKLR